MVCLAPHLALGAKYIGTEASSGAALVSQAELRIQHRTAQACTDGVAPGSDSGVAASSAEASPENLNLRSYPSRPFELAVSGPGFDPAPVSVSASRAADTVVSPVPVGVQAFCETSAFRADMNSLGTGVGEEFASGTLVGILGVGSWTLGDVCRSNNLESGHGYCRLNLPVCVLD